jgi:hypothetical protein
MENLCTRSSTEEVAGYLLLPHMEETDIDGVTKKVHDFDSVSR